MNDVREYRYNGTARQRSLLWLAFSLALVMILVVALITQRAQFGLLGLIVGAVLSLSLVLTIRAQLAVAFMRCRLATDQIELHAPLNHRLIRWRDIVEVRRAHVPKLGSQARWACIVLTKSARGSQLPTLLFDDQLERADEALEIVTKRTPHARHVLT